MTEPLLDLAAVMARLRDECAWTAAQTHQSLTRYLLEEAHETVEAIEAGDEAHLREELGDLLLQVYFHSEIADSYDVSDVAQGLIDKLVRRNPHVFGDTPSTDPDQITATWERIKAEEKAARPAAAGRDRTVASLPTLLYADKVIDRRARVGRPLTSAVAADATADPERALGDRLVALCVEAHAQGVDLDALLRRRMREQADADDHTSDND